VKLTIPKNVAPSLIIGGATPQICGQKDRLTDMKNTVRHFLRLSEGTLNSKCTSRLTDPTKLPKILISRNFANNSKLHARRN
jgi:hypothetical protein